MTDEMKILFPEEVYKLESGEQVFVRPVPFGKLKVFSEAVASLTLKLSGLGLDIKNVDDWKVLFDVAFEETLNVMGIVLEKPREWFDMITISDGIGLLAIIVEQNLNEGAKKNIHTLIEKVTLLLQTSSSSSSAPGTAGRESKVIP